MGIHIIDNMFRFYYDDYKWCKSCDHTLCKITSDKNIVLQKEEGDNCISSLLHKYFQEEVINEMTCPKCDKITKGGTVIHARQFSTQLMLKYQAMIVLRMLKISPKQE